MKQNLVKAQFGSLPETAWNLNPFNRVIPELFGLLGGGGSGGGEAAPPSIPDEGMPVSDDLTAMLTEVLGALQSGAVTPEDAQAFLGETFGAPVDPAAATGGTDMNALLAALGDGESQTDIIAAEKQLGQADELGALLSLVEMIQGSGTTPATGGTPALMDIPPELMESLGGPTRMPIDPWMAANPELIPMVIAEAELANQRAIAKRQGITDFLIGTQYETPGTPAQSPDFMSSFSSAQDFLNSFLGRPTRAQAQQGQQMQAMGGNAQGLIEQIMGLLNGAQTQAMAPQVQQAGNNFMSTGLGSWLSGSMAAPTPAQPQYHLGEVGQ